MTLLLEISQSKSTLYTEHEVTGTNTVNGSVDQMVDLALGLP